MSPNKSSVTLDGPRNGMGKKQVNCNEPYHLKKNTHTQTQKVSPQYLIPEVKITLEKCQSALFQTEQLSW